MNTENLSAKVKEIKFKRKEMKAIEKRIVPEYRRLGRQIAAFTNAGDPAEVATARDRQTEIEKELLAIRDQEKKLDAETDNVKSDWRETVEEYNAKLSEKKHAYMETMKTLAMQYKEIMTMQSEILAAGHSIVVNLDVNTAGALSTVSALQALGFSAPDLLEVGRAVNCGYGFTTPAYELFCQMGFADPSGEARVADRVTARGSYANTSTMKWKV